MRGVPVGAGRVARGDGCRPAVNGGAPTTWTTQGVLMVKSPVVLTGLTPGTTYFFQARALLKDGYTDWSDPISFICI